MKMRIYSILVTFMLCSIFVNAQTDDQGNQMLNITLPPLEELFNGAKQSSTVEYYNTRKEGEDLALKSERRKWLSNFSIYATYQYGLMGINSYNTFGYDSSPVYQYSGSSQLWYNVGGAIRIPLDQIFDRRNKIKAQKLMIKQTSKETDMWYDSQKLKIIELYSKATQMISNLKYVTEQVTLADAQFGLAQKDYVAGNISIQELNSAKGQQVQSHMQFEQVKAELVNSVLQLEVISNVKIISK